MLSFLAWRLQTPLASLYVGVGLDVRKVKGRAAVCCMGAHDAAIGSAMSMSWEDCNEWRGQRFSMAACLKRHHTRVLDEHG